MCINKTEIAQWRKTSIKKRPDTLFIQTLKRQYIMGAKRLTPMHDLLKYTHILFPIYFRPKSTCLWMHVLADTQRREFTAYNSLQGDQRAILYPKKYCIQAEEVLGPNIFPEREQNRKKFANIALSRWKKTVVPGYMPMYREQ